MLNKLEKFLFYLFLFSIPFQTRVILHKWTLPFNEWTAAFIYGTDILLVIILGLWLLRTRTVGPISKADWWPLAFWGISLVSISVAGIKGLAAYKLLKLSEFILLYFYVKNNLGKVYNFQTASVVLIFSGLFQSVIAITQYAKQASLGLRWLGESPLSVATTNVAVIIANGERYLRAYGTTPHPNVLAAWLLFCIFAFYYYFSKSGRWWHLVGYAVMLVAFFLTYSRVIIGVWFLAFVVLIWLKRREKQTIKLVSTTIVVCAIFTLIFWPQVNSRIHISADEEAVTQRVYYNNIAGNVLKNNLFFGIGTGQFVANLMKQYPRYPWMFYQPVHNIYLLIASETGLFGLAAFLVFLFLILKNHFEAIKSNSSFALVHTLLALSCLLIGLFDHFLWTLQQGGLLLWILLAEL